MSESEIIKRIVKNAVLQQFVFRGTRMRRLRGRHAAVSGKTESLHSGSLPSVAERPLVPLASASRDITISKADLRPKGIFSISDETLRAYRVWAIENHEDYILAILDDLLKNGSRPRQTGRHDYEVHALAEMKGGAGILKAVLNAGGDPDAMDGDALGAAFTHGHIRHMLVLLKAGANPFSVGSKYLKPRNNGVIPLKVRILRRAQGKLQASSGHTPFPFPSPTP